MTLIEDLLDLQVPNSIALSPNGQHIVYSTTLPMGHRTGEHDLSTLWTAQTGKPHSARQLTSGKYNDRAPEWTKDGQSVAFLSDRGKAGESCAIYSMPVSSGGEPLPLTPAEHEQGIKKFAISPDGKKVAFLSPDEKSEEKKKREKEKDDAFVWGQDWEFTRLRVLDVTSKEVSVLVSKDAQILDFAWNDDGTALAFAETKNTTLESLLQFGATFSTIDVKTKEVRQLCHFPVVGVDISLVWAGEELYFRGPVAEKVATSSYMVYNVSTTGAQGKTAGYERCAHGETNCANFIRKVGADVVAGVLDGMTDEIRILNGRTLFSAKRQLGSAWAAAFTPDSDEIILALAMGTTSNPTEVFTTTASGGALVQLSDHGKPFAGKEFGKCVFLSCPSAGGEVELQMPFLIPASAAVDADGKPKEPLPTAVMIHGGPYSRHTEAFDSLYFMWTPPLLDAGYAVLLADYRGSSGRGEKFAAYARGVGKYDYDDIITCTNHAIEKGYTNKSKVLVGGYSQGGFLSYLACVRNGTHGLGWEYQAAIPGAGVIDQETMTLTSDIGRWEAEIGGVRPWKATDRNNTQNRQGSAIWEFGSAVANGVKIPPVLILHGEQDKRVPLEQAVGFRRALEDAGLPFEYVTYPREDHIMKERKHLVDMAERIKRWCDTYIGSK